MSAVLAAREPSARYLEAAQPTLVRQFDLLGSAPGGISRLRELILTLAVQGKLAPQLPGEEPASLLLRQIESEQERLIAAGAMKRPKIKDEIAEDELPFPTPPGWQWVRLGTLLQKIGAGSTPLGGKEVYVPSGVKFLRSQNVWNDGLQLDGVAYISPATHAKMAGTVVKANDLLFNITGASIGRCAAVPADFDEANVSQHVTIIRPVLPALNPFLHTVLISRLVQQAVMEVQVGVSREGLSIAKLGNFLVPIPPLQEQARIVARVADLMRLCDALEAKGRLEAEQHARLLGTLLGTLTYSSTPEELAANWQRVADHFDLLLDRPEAVDALEQTILQLAVRGLLIQQDASHEPADRWVGRTNTNRVHRRTAAATPTLADTDRPGLPAGWCVTNVGSVAECLDYIRRPIKKSDREASGGSIPYYGANGQVGWIDEHLFDEDLVLVVEDETFIGRTKPFSYVVRGKSWVNNHAHVLRPLGGLSADFLNLCLERYDFIPLTSGTTNRRKLTQPGLLNAEFMIGPIEEQVRILARVTELRRLCAGLRERLAASQTTQSHLAEALVDEVA